MVTGFRYLFTPIDVGPMRLRNRIVSSPHGTLLEGDERYLYYQIERAKGGAAMLCTGITEIDPRYVSVTFRGLIANVDDSIIPWYRKISDAVHEHGAKFVVELSHRANLWPTRLYPEAAPVMAASTVPGDITREAPLEIDREGVERMARLFGLAAARCKAGGCDGIIILAAAGHLLMEFYSPLFNTRTDEFSGPMENRLRPLFMVIDEIRNNIGRDMALGVRICGDEFMEGGVTIDDAKAVAILLDKSGQVDWIDVFFGNVGNWLSRAMELAPMYVPLGAYVPLAAAIREVVSIPVVAGGRINDPVQAEKILADGHADLVGMCRALIADPYLPNKAKAGQLEDIRHCVGAAEGCISRVEADQPVSCVQNPVVGREKEWAELKPASVKKKVMVIGGGPAGLEAARVATLRGHTVTLYEKTGELGGQVLIASKAPTRQELASITRWLSLQVQKLGVDIHRATEQNLVDERSVLLGKVSVGQRVVVLDGTGDTVGCSTAEFLAEQGKQVYILDKGYQVGENIDLVTRPLVYRSLLGKGVILMPSTWVRSISDREVITYNTFTFKEGKIEDIDTVVHAMPAVADNQIYKSLRGKVKELHAIGDCAAPRRIETAIYEGSKAGREV